MDIESDDEDDWEPSQAGSGNKFEAQPQLAASATASHSAKVREITSAQLHQLTYVCFPESWSRFFMPKHAAVYLYCHWTACSVLHMLGNGHQLLATGAQTSVGIH